MGNWSPALVLLTASASVSLAQYGLGGRNGILDASATCNEDSIFFRLNFQRPFQGLVYTENQWPQCIYVNGSANPRQSYDVSIPLRGCNTRRLPSGALENAVIVQSDARVLEATDRKFLLNCHPRNYGGPSTSFTVGFGGVTVLSDLSSTEVVTGAGNSGELDYTVEVIEGRGPVGRFVQRPLSVGEEISYVVRVADTRGADVRIGACWARDGQSSIQLSDERGCSLQEPGNNIWNQFQSRVEGEGKVFWNDIRAWAFPTSSKVDIYCNLHVCPTTCPFYQCRRLSRREVLDVAAEQSMRAEEDAVVPVEGSFEVSNLGKIDVLNADFTGWSTGGGGGEEIGEGGEIGEVSSRDGYGPHSRSTSPDQVCLSRFHFALALALALSSAGILLCMSLVCAFRLCLRRQPQVLKSKSSR